MIREKDETALAQPTCICGDIVDELSLAQSTVSQHLEVLKDAGLIRGDVNGPRSCYCIEPRPIRRLKALIGESEVMSDPIKVLFVCIHNAARSRMAEALLRSLGGPRFEVTSSGYDPHEVNPLVVEALHLAGLSLANPGPQPSVFDLYKAGRMFAYVIGVCDEEHDQKCPLFPGVTQRLSWSFPDPSTFTGSHTERLARVVEVREAIRARIETWLGILDVTPTT